MPRRARGAMCSLLLVVLGGCAAPVAPPGRASEAILQGTPDPDGDPSVVFIQMNAANGGGFCTGSVISPHVVITAAHCVDPAEIGADITSVRVYLGSVQGTLAVQDLPNWRAAREWHFNPDFNQDGNLSHDNGLILFDDPLPRTPLPLLLTGLGDEQRGATIRLVGFGLHRLGDELSFGSRYQTTAVISGFGEQLVDYQGNAHSICSGDSGGPSFLSVGGVEHIIGVHSFTLQDCIGFAHDSRVDSNFYWSAAIIEGADPGTLPPGAGAIVDMPAPDMGGAAYGGDGCAMGGGSDGAGLALLLVAGIVGAALATRTRGRDRARATTARS